MFKQCASEECKDSVVVPNYPQFDDQITNCPSNVIYGSNVEPAWQPTDADPVTYYNTIGPQLCTADYTKHDGCYYSSNPLTFDSMRAQRMGFARPHLQTKVDIHHTSPEYIQGYQLGCHSYSELQGGNEAFYTAPSQTEAHKTPLFAEPHLTLKTVYKDPMGRSLPEYKYIPNDIPFQKGKELSFIHDTNAARSYLLAKQMNVMNQSDYNLYHS